HREQAADGENTGAALRRIAHGKNPPASNSTSVVSVQRLGGRPAQISSEKSGPELSPHPISPTYVRFDFPCTFELPRYHRRSGGAQTTWGRPNARSGRASAGVICAHPT